MLAHRRVLWFAEAPAPCKIKNILGILPLSFFYYAWVYLDSCPAPQTAGSPLLGAQPFLDNPALRQQLPALKRIPTGLA